jgi:hypothetical protein
MFGMRRLFVGETQVETTLKQQTLKIVGSIGALLALTAWAHEFVWTGIKSNLYLNGAIIGLFSFGVIMVLAGLKGLRNEGLALAALQEVYDDIRNEKAQSQRDPFWRHYRALQPGRVFARPSVLGHMFELTYDELLRSKDIRISVGTMQNLVQGIESKLADQRSLSVYITGLLVFLGLIGTFIGLMEMVGSVGGIIGSLQGMQSATGTAVQQLLKNLEEPLRGMATGFSSSLFGLFGSLTLGVIGRMGATASNAMKHEFEDWLAGVAQLENRKSGEVGDLARMISNNLMGVPQPAGASGQGAAAPGAQAAPPTIGVSYGGHSPLSDVGVVATLSQGFGRSNDSLSSLNANMGRLVEAQEGAAEMIRQMAASIDRMAGDAAQTREHLMTVASQQNTHAEYLQELVNLNRTLESRLTSGFNGMAHVMEVTGQAYLDGLRRLTAENYETNARLAKLLDVKAASDRITEIATGIESKVKGSFGTMTTMLERTAVALESSVHKVAEGQKEIKEALKSGVGGTVGMSSDFEQKLASSFSEMSRSFETVFAAYSTIVSKALVNQPAGQGGAPGDGAAMARERALQAAWTPAPKTDGAEEQSAAAEDESRRQFYEMAARQLRGGQVA